MAPPVQNLIANPCPVCEHGVCFDGINGWGTCICPEGCPDNTECDDGHIDAVTLKQRILHDNIVEQA